MTYARAISSTPGPRRKNPRSIRSSQLARLYLAKGDVLYATELADGITLSPYDPKLARQMDFAEQVTRKDRNVLRKLAGSRDGAIVWFGKAAVPAIRDRQIAQHGGSAGIRDEGLLEPALARPRRLHAYGDPAPDLVDPAATLAHGLARNPPFVDDNKRTAHVAHRTFLLLSGAELEATDEEKFVAMLALAEGRLSETAFAAWPRLAFEPRGAAHEPRKPYRTRRRASSRVSARGR